MKLNLRSTGLSMALAIVVLGAACNDDNNSVTPTPIPTPTPAPEATPTPAPTPTPTPSSTAGTEVSFLGKVKSVDMDESMLRVNADDVVVSGSTTIQREDGTPLTLNALSVGSSVRVKGSYNEDGSAILAQRITLLQ